MCGIKLMHDITSDNKYIHYTVCDVKHIHNTILMPSTCIISCDAITLGVGGGAENPIVLPRVGASQAVDIVNRGH